MKAKKKIVDQMTTKSPTQQAVCSFTFISWLVIYIYIYIYIYTHMYVCWSVFRLVGWLVVGWLVGPLVSWEFASLVNDLVSWLVACIIVCRAEWFVSFPVYLFVFSVVFLLWPLVFLYSFTWCVACSFGPLFIWLFVGFLVLMVISLCSFVCLVGFVKDSIFAEFFG